MAGAGPSSQEWDERCEPAVGVGRRGRSCPASVPTVRTWHARSSAGRFRGGWRALPIGAASSRAPRSRPVSAGRNPTRSVAVGVFCRCGPSGSRSPGGRPSRAPAVPRLAASIRLMNPHALSMPTAIQAAGRAHPTAGTSPRLLALRSGRAARSRSSGAAARRTVSIWLWSRRGRVGPPSGGVVMLGSSMRRPSCFRSDGRSVACRRPATSSRGRAPSESCRSERARRSRTGGPGR